MNALLLDNVVSRAEVAVPAVPASPILQVNGVCKGFGSGITRTEILANINLSIRAGEFLAIVGFSGSGKTTLTQILAGLLEPDRGEVLMEGRTIHGPGPDRGMVFQNYSLLPWLTVRGNIDLSVDRVFRDWSKTRRREHVDHFIELVGLKHAAHRRPHELSGGMKQRTSLARTLAMKPKVLLLDEPLSALDALTRAQLQEEILKIWQEERQTCVMITNDVDEALLLADRIVPLNPGPCASLGPVFTVDLCRPRDKTALNHNATFKDLRNTVTNYLVSVRQQARNAQAAANTIRLIEPPTIRPREMSLRSKYTVGRSH